MNLIPDSGTNNIDDPGAIALARSLKVNTTLQKINLKNNDITTEGILALKEITKVNTSLSIDLNYIHIDNKETNIL